ncbi:MAG: hypothetical protein M3O02_09325 [Acidobacteriota bacterium]|nr:hypothetical protein [Acidobacteriota bacterium]
MRSTRWIGPGLQAGLVVGLVLGVAAPLASGAQDASEKHGRKYKAPPETSRIEVTVLKGFNKKPIMNAAVIFHPIDASGKDEGTLEVKSGPDGKATIDVIPVGSQVRLQVLANGFATYAGDFKIDTATREITVSMIRPQSQISAYVDNEGKPADTQPGIQEPVRSKKKTAASESGTSGSGAAGSAGSTAAPASTTKPQN